MEMSNEIKVSIIVPVYNASKYLKQCMDSILGQTLKDIEIICVNDGSTDNSLEILKKYQEDDSRIIIYNQKNSGAAVARNKGLDLAKGIYIGFMDPDDYYPDDSVLFSVYKTACDNKALITGGSLVLDRTESHYQPKYEIKDERFFDSDGFIKYIDYQYDFYYQRFIYKKELIDKNNITFPLYRRGQDIPFFVKAMISAEKFYSMKKKTYCYRVGHKKVNWHDNKIAIHAIEATSDIIKIAHDNKLQKLYERSILRLLRYCNEILEYNNDIDVLKVLYSKISAVDSNNSKEINNKSEILLAKINFLLKKEKAKKDKSVEIIAGKGHCSKVSVIIPVYNVKEYLTECMNSICQQTLKDIEIICVNDGSTDNSLAILREFADKDNRIIILSQENSGLSVARNTGLKFANSEYIYFCDSDDKLELSALEELYNRSKADNLDMLYFDAEVFFESEELENTLKNYKNYYKRKKNYLGNYEGIELFNKLLKNSDYLPSACLNFLKRSFLLDNKLIFEPGILHEDNLWSFKCALLAKRVGYLSRKLFYRRVRPNSIVSQKVTYEHVYGYFLSAIKGIEFLKNVNLNQDESDSINKLISTWVTNSKNKYNKLNLIEKAKAETLNSYERSLFNLLIIRQSKNTESVVKSNKNSKAIIFKVYPYYKKNGLRKTILKVKEKLFKFLK